MCTPPHCEPARRCLGCISLRKAAAGILGANAVYGFMLVLVHMMILTQRGGHASTSIPGPTAAPMAMPAPTPAPAMSPPVAAQPTTLAPAMQPKTPAPVPSTTAGLEQGTAQERRLQGSVATRHGENWFWQVVDLDIAWAHGALGMGDWCLCIFGLLYGIVIIASSVFVLHAVLTAPRSASAISRWFMIFMHFELGLYAALVVIKLPLLCHMKHHFLNLMEEDCTVLRYMFFERAANRLIIGSLCCWMFSSFAYLLAWGDPVIDDPSVLDQGLQVQGPLQGVIQEARPQSFRQIASTAFPQDKYALVGEPVAASFKVEPRGVAGSFHAGVAGSFRGGVASSFHGGSSFYDGGSFPRQDHFERSQGFPRASSSMVIQQGDASRRFGDRQPLIKPPIVIH